MCATSNPTIIQRMMFLDCHLYTTYYGNESEGMCVVDFKDNMPPATPTWDEWYAKVFVLDHIGMYAKFAKKVSDALYWAAFYELDGYGHLDPKDNAHHRHEDLHAHIRDASFPAFVRCADILAAAIYKGRDDEGILHIPSINDMATTFRDVWYGRCEDISRQACIDCLAGMME